MKIRFDEKRAREVFAVLEKDWKNKERIFNGIILPQDRYSAPNGKKEYANWLFYCAFLMRGAVNSDDPFKWLFALREKYPDLFNPDSVVKNWSPEKIQKAFKEITPEVLNGNGVGKNGAGALGFKIVEYTKTWYENSVVLNHWWGSDIRNVFWGVAEFEEVFRRVDYYRTEAGFKGMRRKIFSLLTIWLQEKNIIPIFSTPIPIDFHAMRILWQTDILLLNGFAKPFKAKENYSQQLDGKQSFRISEKFVDMVAKWSQKFMVTNGFSHLAINPAVWILSRSLCADHLQASSRANGEKFIESEKLAENGIAWPKKYKDPCSYCSVEKWCKWVIPANPYYRFGILIKIGKRIHYPVVKFHGFEKFFPYQSRKKLHK